MEKVYLLSKNNYQYHDTQELGGICYRTANVEQFMATWLRILYRDQGVSLELEPGDTMQYCFCARLLSETCRRESTHASPIVWHNCVHDHYLTLPPEILSPNELLRLTPRGINWNPYTLAVFASLHYAYCDFFLSSHDAVIEQYESRFYDWANAKPLEDGLCKLFTSTKAKHDAEKENAD